MIRDDLMKHFILSFMIASVLCIPFQFKKAPSFLIGGATVTLSIGLAKEYYDMQTTGFDGADLIADALGTGLAVGLHFLVGGGDGRSR